MSSSKKYTETKIHINDILYINDKESDNDVEQFVHIDNNLIFISHDSDDSVASDNDDIILTY